MSSADFAHEEEHGVDAMNEALGEIATPVNFARICAVFDREGWKYECSDSEIRGGFDSKPVIVHFSEQDNRLDFSSIIVDGLADLDADDLLGFIEEWHCTRILPKAYLFSTEDLENVIRLEHAVLFTDGEGRPVGATDGQLQICVKQFIYAVLSFHQEFAAAYGEGIES